MRVSDALKSRISCRAFTEQPVERDVIERILVHAGMAPSGGNLQPWHVDVLAGCALANLLDDINAKSDLLPKGEGTEYQVYPPGLPDPYAGRRSKCGADLYSILGIERHDRAGRMRQFARNFTFFDAPVGLFISVDRDMGPPQWADLGIFIQSIMLMAREEGLHTCPQEAWASFSKTVSAHLNLPDERMLFCGIALGVMDDQKPENGLRTDRMSLDEFVSFHGI
ncbi:MAG: nitroreductase [Pseudomonadota bacterium]